MHGSWTVNFSLTLLGGHALTGADGALTGPPVQRHRMALLALLAVAGSRGFSREKLMGLLWPDRDEARARSLLNQAVHALRRGLGDQAILSVVDDLQLNEEVVASDVAGFANALSAGAYADAAARYAGSFLDGFFLSGAAAFERWVDGERDRLSNEYARVLERLATAAESEGDVLGAVTWWKARAAHDPFDSRVAVQVMRALDRAGNRAGALHHAAAHERRLRMDLDLDPPQELTAEVERLRKEPAVVPVNEVMLFAEASSTLSSPPTRGLDDARIASLDTPPASHAPAASAFRTWHAGVAALVVMGAVFAGSLTARGDSTEQTTAPAIRPRTRNVAAYELYVRGNDPVLLRSDSGARRGLEYFRRAVSLDSTYAAAWAGLARMQMRIADNWSGDARAKALADAEAAVRVAVALDDSLAEGHAGLGLIRAMVFDLPDAERHFKRAIALAPNDGRQREWAANFYLLAERPVEALAEAGRALELDPLSPSAVAEYARALLYNDRCDEALARIRPIMVVDPPLLRAAPIAAQCYGRKGQWLQAIEVLKPQAARHEVHALATLGYMYAHAGQRAQAEAIQAQLTERWRAGSMGTYYLAFIPAALGDHDAAFAWIERAVADRSLGFFPGRLPGLTDPLFDDLRGDVRLDALRRRLGLARQ
jgi:serine/threonine-protein kinase